MKRSALHVWIEAARPQTLAAAFVPVLTGAALAFNRQALDWTPTLVALACAFLIQIGTNFANDYFDFVKGADTEDRIGFERATATGQISAGRMKAATIGTMSLAFLLGLYLVWHAGWVILAIGLLSLLCGVLYTGGPFPLGYNGLGDLFVFLFFGIVAVTGTYYVNALEWTAAAVLASLPIGALATNILVVNNLRDVEQDGPAGKNTLGVLLGEQALRWEYLLMQAVAFAVPLLLYLRFDFGRPVLLPLLSLPAGAWLLAVIWKEQDKRNLNNRLKHTAVFMTLYGLLFSAGLALG